MIKKGKYFVETWTNDSSFKELFRTLAAAGAGRPVDADGFPSGPWTPELLATAISECEGNAAGIELRTVQLWFQENDRGISSENIRWLARVFGCGDPKATADWQVALSAALARQKKRKRVASTLAPAPPTQASPNAPVEAVLAAGTDPLPQRAQQQTEPEPLDKARKRGFSLWRWSESIFSRESPLDLPSAIFAGAVALGFVSFIMGVHNVTYDRHDGVTKQVGFLWSPNWTILFMAFLPLFLVFASKTVLYWKGQGRKIVGTSSGTFETSKPWLKSVEGSSYTFWSVFIICIVFAGIAQWYGVRLKPLLDGYIDNYAVDWGSVTTVRPEVTTVGESIVFTAAAYLYMSVTFYIMFVGLILLYIVIHDYIALSGGKVLDVEECHASDGSKISVLIMTAVFRCTMLGILIALTMKVQSIYLISGIDHIGDWFIGDMTSFFLGTYLDEARILVSVPNHYSSLVVVLGTLAVFFYGVIGLKFYKTETLIFGRMVLVVGLLCAAYLLLGAFVGHTILVTVSVALSTYAIFDPRFSFRRSEYLNRESDVL